MSSKRTVAPWLRGLTRSHRYGLHVRPVDDREGGEEVALLPAYRDDAAYLEELRSAFGSLSRAGEVRAVSIPGVGRFALGLDLDGAEANAEAVAAGRAPTAPTAAGPGAPDQAAASDSYAIHLDRGGVVAGAISAVTGGAQGFGEEIVRHLVSAGSTVFVIDLNEDGAKSLCDELNGSAGKTVAVPVAADVTSEDSVRDMVGSIVDRAGGIDLYVSNAGVLKAGSVKELELSAFDFVTKVNYTGYFLGVKHVSPVMALEHDADSDYRSDIVQINSKSGLEGSNKNGAYAGGKFGGVGLTQSFALELIEDGIKVNSVCPGNFFEGPLWSDPEKGLFVQYLRAGKVPGAETVEDVRAYYESRVPMGRGCTGGDVMRAIYYIVEQVYETGQAVPVTGGQVMLK